MKIGYIYIMCFCLLSSCSESIPVKLHKNFQIKAELLGFDNLDEVENEPTYTEFPRNEELGVFVVKEHFDGLWNTYEKIFDNLPFLNDSQGVFHTNEENVYFDNMDELQIRAYYPYKPNHKLVDDSYTVNTEHQNALAQDTLDILYSEFSPSVSPNSSEANIHLAHVMSKVVLNITPEVGTSPQGFVDSSPSLKTFGIDHEAQFNVFEGTFTNFSFYDDTKIDIVPTINGNKVVYTLYLIPQDGLNLDEMSLLLTVGDYSYNIIIPLPVVGQIADVGGAMIDTYGLKGGEEYVYNINLKSHLEES